MVMLGAPHCSDMDPPGVQDMDPPGVQDMDPPGVQDMDPPSVQDLDTMRYSELQRLAKAHGLKANLKAGILLKKLKGHFHPNAMIGNSSTDSDEDYDKEQSANTEDKVLASVSFVTLRRGKRQKYISPKAEVGVCVLGSTDEREMEVRQTGSAGKMKKGKPGSGNKRKCRVANEESIQVPEEHKKNAESCAPPGCKIPRYAARLPKPNTKPSTPNFKMLHEAHFKKMESIDKYMERKQRRLDAVSSSIREVKMLAKTSNLLEGSEKTPSSSSKKPIKGRLSLMSPVPQKTCISSSKTPASQRRSRRSDLISKSILQDKSGFQPSVFTVSKMNVRFSMATKDNEYKHSLAKTPARKSAGFGNVTPGNASTKCLPKTRKSSPDNRRISNTDPHKTPLKFTGKSSETPNTKKSRFDLQASLSRPLGYEPHKGKLKPWGNGKENQSAVKANVSVLKATYKQPQLRTREDRRRQHEENRKGQRDKTLGNRRGLAVP